MDLDEEIAFLRNQLRELDELLQNSMKQNIGLKIELFDARTEIKKLKSDHMKDMENTKGSISSTIDKLNYEIRRMIQERKVKENYSQI